MTLKMGICFWKHFLFFLPVVTKYLFFLSTSQPDFLYHLCIGTSGNYTKNSPYQTNLDTLLSSISSDIDDYGFYSSSVGRIPNTAHAIALCRGDVEPEDCRNCTQNSKIKLQKSCPNYKEAVGWYDDCMLRYSNKTINGTVAMPDSQIFILENTADATDVEQFNKNVRKLLDSLRDKAADGGDHMKFSTGNITAGTSDAVTIFGLVQCTPDLSKQECRDCLLVAFGDIPSGKVGGRVVGPSCNLRYETYQFFNSSTVPVVETPSPLATPPVSAPPLQAPPISSAKGSNNIRSHRGGVHQAHGRFLSTACAVISLILYMY